MGEVERIYNEPPFAVIIIIMLSYLITHHKYFE